jgi:hypothetical protein
MKFIDILKGSKAKSDVDFSGPQGCHEKKQI